MTNYRALCAELADDLEPWITYGEIEAIEKSHNLIDRARAALAAEPEPPVKGEVAELVAWLHGQDGGIGRRATYSRIADLLSRLVPQPQPEPPADGEVAELVNHLLKVAAALRAVNSQLSYGHVNKLVIAAEDLLAIATELEI